MGNTKPIGVAYSDQDISGADNLSAVDIYATDEIGYAADAQGTVTQLTDKGTAVTLNKSAGQITTAASTIAANGVATFTLNNSLISAKDAMIINVGSGATTAGQYTAYVTSLTSGAAIIAVRNLVGSTSPGDTLVLNYAIIHCT
jgi:hypothetical protein